MEGNLTEGESQQIVRLDQVNSWVYFIIQNPGRPVTHGLTPHQPL